MILLPDSLVHPILQVGKLMIHKGDIICARLTESVKKRLCFLENSQRLIILGSRVVFANQIKSASETSEEPQIQEKHSSSL